MMENPSHRYGTGYKKHKPYELRDEEGFTSKSTIKTY